MKVLTMNMLKTANVIRKTQTTLANAKKNNNKIHNQEHNSFIFDNLILHFGFLDSNLEGCHQYRAGGVYKDDRREKLDQMIQAAPKEPLADKQLLQLRTTHNELSYNIF
jgi:hypothetical protein